MSASLRFPIPFKSARTMCSKEEGPFVVVAMFTSDYAEKASRLAASCDKFGLQYEMHEVPKIHRSISTRGSDDLAYTKANFVHFALARHKKPVLYLDADCEIVSSLTLIAELVQSACNFAIYNAFADEHTDRFVPLAADSSSGDWSNRSRYYRFAGSARWHTERQLKCSGCTQFYRNSLAARTLLARWHRTVANFPGTADDWCLDFVFNNLTRRSWLSWLLRVHWLPKSYARYAWWIHTRPVINHPDLPAGSAGFVHLVDPLGRKVAYTSEMTRRDPDWKYSDNHVIDTQGRMVCKLVDGQPIPVEAIASELWL